MSCSSCIWRHRLIWWRHPLCVTSIDHRFGLRFLRFRHLSSTCLGYFNLHSIAGRASIGLGYDTDTLVTSCVDLHDFTAENRGCLIRDLIRVCAFYSDNSRYSMRSKLRKKTAMPGFEPSTLSMTRLLWDQHSRPLNHHGPKLVNYCWTRTKQDRYGPVEDCCKA